MKTFGSYSYQNHEVKKHQSAMKAQLFFRVGCICLLLQLLVFVACAYCFLPEELIRELWDYLLLMGDNAGGLDSVLGLSGTQSGNSASKIIDTNQLLDGYRIRFILFGVLSFFPWYFIPGRFGLFDKKVTSSDDVDHIRGAKMVSEAELTKLCDSDNKSIINFGNVPLSMTNERLHMFIGGRTGSGKSTILYQHLEAIQTAGRRGVVNDFKGELVEKFYRPGIDHILNPLDMRGLGWTLLNDCKTSTDLSAIASSLIPPMDGDQKFWSAAAQAVLKGVMSACIDSGTCSNADLWKVLTLPTKQIADICKSTPAGRAGFSYIQDADSKLAGGVIAELISYTSWLEYATDGDFSISDWLTTGTGVIFLTSKPEVAHVLKPYISLFIDLLGSKALSMPDNTNSDKNIYFILDEFANLQKLPNITQLLTAGRSKGLIIEIGVQELAGIENIYGRNASRTIMNNCGTKMILPVGDPDTADYFSKLAGEQEYWQASTSYAIGKEKTGGENHSRQVQRRSVILPSDIMRLAVGEGYLVMPGQNPAKIKIPFTYANKRPVINKGLIFRDLLNLDDVQQKAISVIKDAEYTSEIRSEGNDDDSFGY